MFALSKDTSLNVYVPTTNQLFGIAPASAIVGVSAKQDMYQIYHEGNVLGLKNAHQMARRLDIAASRLLSRAPTISRFTLNSKQLDTYFIKVGTYSLATQDLHIDKAHRLLWEDWCEAYEEFSPIRINA